MRQSSWSWAVSIVTALIPASMAATHDVAVGLNHDFQPDVIIADPGDVIHFTFYPQNHSVVRAEYLNPCIPYDYVHPGEHSFFSGNMESDEGQEPLTWDLTVNNTDPTYFYCSAPKSCIEYKMVGVINPDKNHTLQTQLDKVDGLFYQLSPGEEAPEEGSNNDGGNGDSSTDSPSSDDGISSGDNGGQGGQGKHGTHLSGGAIAGIAIGAAAVLLIAIGLVYFCGRKGGIEKGYRRSGVRQSAVLSPPMVEFNYAESAAGAGPDTAYNPSKSPAPTSPYPVPSHASTYRSSSPANWSSPMGSPQMDPSSLHSPHHSYSGHPSAGYSGFGTASELSAAPYDPHFPPQEIAEAQAPVELPDNSHSRQS